MNKAAVAQTTNVDELVGLLALYGSDRLEDLRAKYPDYAILLKPGIVAGISVDSAVRVRVDVAREALVIAVSKSQEAISSLRKRLSTARQLQFASQLNAFLAGSALIVMIKVQSQRLAQYVAAVVATLSSLLALWSQNTMSSHFSKHNLMDEYSKLVESHVVAEQILSSREICVRTGEYSGVEATLRRANSLAADIKRILLLV